MIQEHNLQGEPQCWKVEHMHLQSELADYARDVAQLRQERDALRLRIKAVDAEHIQLAEERKKMIDAYTKVEEQKNFWEREHKALMETCHVIQKKLDALADELREARKDRQELLSALVAIKHRHKGVFDSWQLKKFGLLSTNRADDMATIAELAYDKVTKKL